MDHSLALMAAMIAALRADGAVSGFVGDRVWDDVPETGAALVFPYLTIEDGGSVPEFATGVSFETYAPQVHIWSRHRNRTSTECRLIRAAVVAALQDAELDLGPQAALAQLRRGALRMFRDPDGVTWHGVAEFDATLHSAK